MPVISILIMQQILSTAQFPSYHSIKYSRCLLIKQALDRRNTNDEMTIPDEEESSLFTDYLLTYDINNLKFNEKNSPLNQHSIILDKAENNLDEILLPIDPNDLVPVFQRDKNDQLTAKIDWTGKKLIQKFLEIFALNKKFERRFLLMLSPFRRLLIGLLAPRLLRFQMNILTSALLEEILKKILGPILGLSIEYSNDNPIKSIRKNEQLPPIIITNDQLKQLEQLALLINQLNLITNQINQ